MSKRLKKIVCLGAGTGASVVLSGLKKYPLDLATIVTMFDSGGSSGKLRKELNILPLGDIRQCLVALSDENNLTPFLNYRFEGGKLKGHNFGNLLLAAATKTAGSLNKAIEKVGEIMNIKGKVIPVTLGRADIVAILKNDKKIKEEEKIINCSYLSKVGVKKLFLTSKVKANPQAILSIKRADLIVIAPGKFYTSILPIFLVKGISEAVQKSRAKKVFICNLMTQVGNKNGFSVTDFLMILEKYLGKDIIDYIIFNTGKLSAQQIKEVKRVFPKADFIKYDKNLLKKEKFIGADVIDHKIYRLNPADTLVKGANQRTMVLHHPGKLTKILMKLCRQ